MNRNRNVNVDPTVNAVQPVRRVDNVRAVRIVNVADAVQVNRELFILLLRMPLTTKKLTNSVFLNQT